MTEKMEGAGKSAEEVLGERYRREAREVLGKFFDEYPDPKKRIKVLVKKLEVFNKVVSLQEAVREAVEAGEAEDRAVFLDEVLEALEPIIKMRTEQPEVYKALQESGPVSVENNFEFLTELMTYEIGSDGWMRLHVSGQQGKDPMKLVGLFKKSFKAMAEYLKEHPDILGVVGSSWIVGHPSGERVLRKFGFEVEPMDEGARMIHFSDETRPIKVMRMSRDEVIRRFG